MQTPNDRLKSVIITGATSGIGREVAAACARQKALVIGVGRSAARCATAEAAIRAESPGAQVTFLVADLAVQGQVRRLAGQIRQALSAAGKEGLDVLVNNAGIYSQRYQKTVDNIELTFAVNHLAPFLLTHELMPALLAAPTARIITVSSNSHYRTFLEWQRLEAPWLYNGLWAYKDSKLANVLFTLELNRRLSGTPAQAFAVDPGLVNTEIGLKDTGWISRTVWQYRRNRGVHPEVPARTILHLAFAQEAAENAALYWYDCQPKTPSRQAQRPASAQKLWALSCRLCGILDQPGAEGS